MTPQVRPNSSASVKAPAGRALSPATSLRQQGSAASQPKRNVTSKIASLWKRVEDSKTKAKAEETSKKYKPKDKRIWLGGGKGSQQQQQEETVPAPGKLIRSGTYEKLTEGEETVEVLVETPALGKHPNEHQPRHGGRGERQLNHDDLEEGSLLHIRLYRTRRYFWE